ncbi:hypothetical protein I6H07_06255 [Hafnia alvei]|uniref:hypothetical protein n=1 Tax=Hafnia alvei TaxID=569 RepID=UPI000B6692E5|nr:hypothetical protein [Hafnia alvei]MBI0275437.1 hypothetical protein [Hafnia alvei]PNK98568.1 hypothetical protein CEQ28_013730 [Hafnia alvei]
MKNIISAVVLLGLIVFGICRFFFTDAEVSKLTALSSQHVVTCYNYHQQVYTGVSTGRVQHKDNELYFESADSHKLVEVMLGQSSSCVIEVK